MFGRALFATAIVPFFLASCATASPVNGCSGQEQFQESAQADGQEQAAIPLELTGRVVDAAEIIPARIEAELTRKLEQIETDTLSQIVVVTTPDLNGMDVAQYARLLGNGWGIGDAERDDGVVLLFAPNERVLRIAVGCGLETTLTDELSAEIVSEIVSRIRQDDIASGIQLGVGRIDQELRRALETDLAA